MKEALALFFVRLPLYCFSAVFVYGQTPSPAPPRGDTQLWNEMEVMLPLNKKIDLEFYGQLRLGRDLSHFVDERAGFGLSFRPNQYLNIEPSYRYIAAQPTAGRSAREHRPSFEITVSISVRGLMLSDRNLIERRLRDFNNTTQHRNRLQVIGSARTPTMPAPNNTTQYRNRLQVECPFALGGKNFKLFAADEVFYDSRQRAWIRNRFSLGVIRKFNDRLTGEFYYTRQNDGFSRLGDLHVIGTTLRVRLK